MSTLTVRELIQALLDCDMSALVYVEIDGVVPDDDGDKGIGCIDEYVDRYGKSNSKYIHIKLS